MRRLLVLVGLLVGLAVAACAPASAEVLFSDSFESGDFTQANENFAWGKPTRVHVLPSYSRMGCRSAVFRFDPTPNEVAGNDAFAELRFKLRKPLTEFWLSYYIRFPENYYHRAPVGTANNKFLIMWSKSYQDSGNRLGLQLELDRLWDRTTRRWVTRTGSSAISWTAYTRNSQALATARTTAGHQAKALMVDRAADLGKWMRVVVHWRRASGPGALDGVVEVYKVVDGVRTTVLEERAVQSWGPDSGGDPAYNFLTDGYLLGWANSGFTERTEVAIDDVELHSTRPPDFP